MIKIKSIYQLWNYIVSTISSEAFFEILMAIVNDFREIEDAKWLCH